jgi:hypothetical protein
MKELWRTHRVSVGVSLLCVLLAVNALLSGRFRGLPFTDVVVRRDGDPVLFWAAVAFLISAGLAFPISLLWSATHRKRAVPFDDQIDRLRAAGFDLPDSIVAELQQSASRETCEREPYRAILVALADQDDDHTAPPGHFFYLDTEAIEADGDYVALARKMIAISQGTLTATELTDALDARKKTATLQGIINGNPFRWQMPFEDDYVREEFFDGFRTVMHQAGSGKIYAGLDLGGQDLLVFCVNEEQITRFKETVSLELHPM